MKDKKMHVLVMRRPPLTEGEKQKLEEKFPKVQNFFYHHLSPENGEEWLYWCQSFTAWREDVVVVLPQEKPLPTKAMEAGFTHIAFTPEGPKRLVRVIPEFEPL